MKRTLSALVLAAVAIASSYGLGVAVAGGAVVMVGCSQGCSSSPNAVAYKTIGSLITAVDLARKGWDDYVNAQKAKPLTPAQVVALQDNIDKVQAAYQDYVAAIEALKKAQPGFSNGDPIPSQLLTAGTALIDLITKLKGA